MRSILSLWTPDPQITSVSSPTAASAGATALRRSTRGFRTLHGSACSLTSSRPLSRCQLLIKVVPGQLLPENLKQPYNSLTRFLFLTLITTSHYMIYLCAQQRETDREGKREGDGETVIPHRATRWHYCSESLKSKSGKQNLRLLWVCQLPSVHLSVSVFFLHSLLPLLSPATSILTY